MRREKAWQMLLPVGGNELWDQLPEANRKKCRELLGRLVLAVVTAEMKEREVEDERENRACPS